MVDLASAYSEVKSLPDQALEQELSRGTLPSYLVLAEMNERRSIRSGTPPVSSATMRDQVVQNFAAGGKVATLAELNPFIYYQKGMKNFHQLDDAPAIVDGGLPTLIAPGQPGQPVGLDTLVPLQPGRPKQFAGGGVVSLADIERRRQAFLDAIARRESGGRYNVRFGGKTFNSYADHPRISQRIDKGPNRGKSSSAAGKYQFIKGTWDAQAKRLGLKDFSPASQDKAAWDLASRTFKQKTGLNLDDALTDPRNAAAAATHLRGVWTSLPGGIEQGTNFKGFMDTYSNSLAHSKGPAPAQNFARSADPVQIFAPDPVQVFAPQAAQPLPHPVSVAQPQPIPPTGRDRWGPAQPQVAQPLPHPVSVPAARMAQPLPHPVSTPAKIMAQPLPHPVSTPIPQVPVAAAPVNVPTAPPVIFNPVAASTPTMEPITAAPSGGGLGALLTMLMMGVGGAQQAPAPAPAGGGSAPKQPRDPVQVAEATSMTPSHYRRDDRRKRRNYGYSA